MSNAQTRTAGGDACATILAGPGRLDCYRLVANISERQCLINQVLAQAEVGRAWSVKRLWDCLDCDLGKEVQSRHPEGVEVERRDQFGMPVKFKREVGSSQLAVVSRDACVSAPVRTTGETPVPLDACATGDARPKRKSKPRVPAWLKNATPAVRRSYLKEIETCT